MSPAVSCIHCCRGTARIICAGTTQASSIITAVHAPNSSMMTTTLTGRMLTAIDGMLPVSVTNSNLQVCASMGHMTDRQDVTALLQGRA